MSEELENITAQSEEQKDNSREGYADKTQQDREPRERIGRPQRPRIHTTRSYSSNYGSERVAYTPRRSNDEEGGFRPEGFGTGLQGNGGQQQGGYRPRYNSNGGYQARPQQGYRPRYNQNQEGGESGYQPRSDYGQPRSGYQPRAGYNNRYYRPRYNQNQEGEEGGYQPRQQGGYRPRYNNNAGGYQPRGGYNRGGYQQGGYSKPRGNFRQRTADYDPNAKYSLKKRIEYKEANIDPNEPLRLNKKVNGEVVNQLGAKVLRTDVVTFNDQPVSIEKKVYVLLNKPKDCVTTSDDPQQRKTVMDLVKNVCPERIYPVGRLDRNTTGVLLLTNDGDLASKLTHPKFLKKKVYHVVLDHAVTQADMQQIASGIVLDDGEIHADAIEYAHETDKTQVGIEIHSGKNRIVRRIFESLGYRVVKLDRVQFAGLTKKNLRRGDWRFLTEKEVDMLRMGAFE